VAVLVWSFTKGIRPVAVRRGPAPPRVSTFIDHHAVRGKYLLL
jgi:hypothetical protein